MAKLAVARGFEVVGIGVGSAGVIGPEGQVISAADVIKDWGGVNLATIIAQETRLPASAVNDVHAHALGEAWLGASAHAQSSLMVAFGTGVGGSFIVDGAPQFGAHSLAGHVGHFSSPLADGLDCTCGGKGHVEMVASGPSVLRRYLAQGGAPATDTRQVATRAYAGDKLALEAIEFAGKAAGIALGDLANILDPHLIVVSGGVINLGNDWWRALIEAYEEAALGRAKKTPITAALLGENTALLGAASIAPGFLNR